MGNPLNDIEAFTAASGGLSIGLGIAALGTFPSAASGDFIIAAICTGLFSLLAMIVSKRAKRKSARFGAGADKHERELLGDDSHDVIVTRINGIVKENSNGKM